MNLVSFYRAESYETELLERIVEKIVLDHGGPERLFAKGKKVVIKPNLVVKKKPEGAATTHPALVEAVILYCKKFTDDITVAECSGGPNTEILLSAIYRDTGIEEVCRRHGVPMQLKMNGASLSIANPLSCSEIEVLDEFLKADCFFNLAKMKTHSLTTMTGSAKNLYGTIPGLRKVEYHARFPEVSDFAGLICDLNRALAPTLSIVDGIWGMEKDGPSGGIPKFAGAVFGGVSTFAIDEAMCDFMGIPSSIVPVQVRAKKEGLFDGKFELVGDDMPSAKPTPFLLPDSQKRSILRELPDLFGGKFAKALAPKPKIDRKACIGCGECARLCPQKTIEIKDKKAVIHHKNCIRCWCCQEMCPKKAVLTKSLSILKHF